MPKKNSLYEVPYIYFGIIFFVNFLISVAFLLVSKNSLLDTLLFFSYSLSQQLLEILVLTIMAFWVKKFAPRWLFLAFMGLVFFLLLFHLINFVMTLLMDATFPLMVSLFFTEGFKEFLKNLEATNMGNGPFIALISAIVLIPFIGLFLYLQCEKISKKRGFFIPAKRIYLATLALLLFLVVTESIGFSHIEKSIKKTPFISSLLPHKNTFREPLFLRSFKEEEMEEKRMEALFAPIEKKPNIYLFIIESFRKDAIDEKVAPNLFSFSKQNISFTHSLSNANATQISWFSIFHSRFPFEWNEYRQKWKKGSLPLRILKKLGYSIHVHSSAELCYFHMDELLFGKDLSLIDSYTPIDTSLPAWERDSICISQEDFSKKESTVSIFFLDATHSEYSYPKECEKHTPCISSINYLYPYNDIEKIHNRYRNSVYFIDTLFSKFFNQLKSHDLFDNSIIIVTGDHGEEFFEENSFFHGTHLNSYQLHIPLFYKFPNITNVSTNISSPIDIFPSILDFLSKGNRYSALFDGESIFHKTWPYVVSAKQNGSFSPEEVLITGTYKKLSVAISKNQLSILKKNLYTKENITDFFKPLVINLEDIKENPSR